jgi:hypothetical protein
MHPNRRRQTVDAAMGDRTLLNWHRQTIHAGMGDRTQADRCRRTTDAAIGAARIQTGATERLMR